MCNMEECVGPYEYFRAQQCVQRSNKYHKNTKHTWLPYEHPDGRTQHSLLPKWNTMPFSLGFGVAEEIQCKLSLVIYLVYLHSVGTKGCVHFDFFL